VLTFIGLRGTSGPETSAAVSSAATALASSGISTLFLNLAQAKLGYELAGQPEPLGLALLDRFGDFDSCVVPTVIPNLTYAELGVDPNQLEALPKGCLGAFLATVDPSVDIVFILVDPIPEPLWEAVASVADIVVPVVGSPGAIRDDPVFTTRALSILPEDVVPGFLPVSSRAVLPGLREIGPNREWDLSNPKDLLFLFGKVLAARPCY
jgi:hypothetical protein